MSRASGWTTSPKTGRAIKVGGPTYTKLAQSKKWAPLLSKAGRKKARGSTSKRKGTTTSGPGGSSAYYTGKYVGKGIPEDEFCGVSGGSMPHTYPVNTPGRARAALSYARHAPNPAGIKQCARSVAKKKGWLVDGKIKQR